MQKLEEILRAEEVARHALVDARERAAALLREAEGEANALIENSVAQATEKADALRAAALESADRGAIEIRLQAAQRLDAQMAAARGRLDEVVQRVTRELVG